MDVIVVDSRRRITLPKSARHTHYLVTEHEDGVIVLTPAVVRTELEDRLRHSGMLDEAARRAANPQDAVQFADWEHPEHGLATL